MTEPPKDRWSHEKYLGGKNEPGKYISPKAAFVDDLDQFDPLEFGINMKEAQHLDPSLRLIIEVAHQTLQDSGIAYKGSRTGVFVAQLLVSTDELNDDNYEIESYNGVGKCIAIRANRVSYTFDLRGPSLVVDTGELFERGVGTAGAAGGSDRVLEVGWLGMRTCSSSGTAMHLALNAIRVGEIDQAIVLGASSMVNPAHTISFSKLGVLSPTGSSKSFDASADGYARSEGFAGVLIKRLDQATKDGDRVYSVITGSAANANGRGKSLTMPEGDMQGEVIRASYKLAGREPKDAFYVELHATGTSVGDPIESNAAGKIFREGRDDAHVLRVGSVKGNLGHAEGCSFMASLIKVSLMLHNKELIPNVRFNKPNPKIKFVENKMRVQTELEPLTPEMTTTKDGKFVTSISTYGVGGANAHVVVESFESSACLKPTATITEAAAPAKPLHLFALGTLTEKSMPRWQESLSSHLRDVTDPATWSAIARDLARQARAQPYRSFAVASTLHPALTFTKTAHVPNNADRKLCLVFSGQGPQHIFMGRQLAEAYPAFLESVRESDSILVKSYAQPSFIASSGLFEPGKESSLAASGQWEVKNVVFGIVFMQMGLVDLIKSMGIEYDCVVGHSIGEVAMSYASGHLNKKQAVGVAVARAMAMTGAQGNGSMAALGVGVAQALFILRKVCGPTVASDPLSPGLWIAGINSPEAVTVAGREDLIDKLVALSKDPKDKFFAAKLRVTSAFHTPLMGPQEDVFKRLAEPVLTSSPPRPDCIRVMSTVDGKWLERPLDLSYCWDNIRQPVLFGTAIDKIVKHFGGADSVVFLEVAPHPVLKSYVEQCGGQAVSLVRRPNPKFPALNTGEHHQFLEGLGNLLLAGFSKLDFAKLSGSSAATTGGPKYEDFKRYSLPAYPYTKTSCWSESAYDKSRKHGGKGRPLCAPHFRMGVETHPWVVGHTILGSVLFPGSGYIDAILEHGAMVVTNVTVAKPLVVNGADASPNHLGLHCRDNTWEFRGSTNGTFLNGDVVFDTTYAGGNWSPVNLAVDRKSPRRFDARSLAKEAAATLQASDFYDAIPAGYNYTGHFHDHLREIYEVPDAASHGGNGYLARFEIPDSPELFGAGFCIHPGLLDAFTQTGLAMFIDYQAKTFGTTGLFVPVRIGRLARWDLSGKDNLDEELKGEVWVYFTMREWAPDGPYVTDYVVVNSDGYVILSIDEFEIAKLPATDLVPITDESILERLTTVWQPKRLIASAVELPEVQEPFVMVRDAAPHTRQESAASLSVPDMDDRALSQTGSNTDEDASNAGSVMASAVDAYTGLVVSTVASWCKEQGRAVMRVLELSAGPDCAKAMDEALTEALVDGQLSTELACLGETLEAADAKCAALDYTYARSVVIKDGVFDLNGQELESVDVIVQYATSALSTERLEAGFAKLMPSGCAIVVTSPADASSLASKLTSLGAVDLVTKPIDATGSLLFARKPDAPAAAAPAELAENPVVVFHLTHGNEGELTELSKTVRQGSELYIVGNDDAAGIGALGVAACVAAESPVFEVFSVLFENHSLSKEDRERIVKEIRLRPDLMEQHVKVAKDGSVWVRRLVTAPGDIRQPSGVVAAGNALTYPNTEVDGVQVAAYMPEMVRSEEVEVRVIALSPMDGTKLVSFVGDVTDAGEQSNIIKQTRVFGVVAHPSTSVIVANKKNMVVLPADVDPFHAASLPVNFLAAWMGLVDQRSVSASDTILIHNAAFGFGFAAVQICQRVGCEIFCTVSTEKEAKWIISELGVSAESIFLRQGVAYLQPAQAWLKKRKLSGFDVIFNSPEEDTVAYDSKIISKLGSFICIRSEGRATPTPSNFNACIIDIDELVSAAPQKITKALQIMVEAHRSIPYKVYRHVIAMDNLDAEDADPVSVFETAVIDCQAASIARVEPRAQLFNPRKSYILVGGCSELGVRIMKWMCDHGARNVFITSRRGEKALNKIDMMYVEHLRSVGCHIGVVSADAISKTDMQSLMAQASFIAPIGGVFLMTVVLRDGLFSNLTQDSFDTVYASKVEALNVLLSVISPENMDFLLLFSTVGSVFGNAGQAAYCASQLYLDRIADVLPNTISMSFPPITDSGVFKRLVMATKGRGNSGQLTKMGMSTQQVCNFIGDCLVRPIRHYVPILSMGDVPDTFPTCEPRLFQHLLPFSHFVSKRSTDGGKGSSETPAALIADLVGLSASEIQDNLAITSYGLDSLGASKLSNQLKAKFGIVVSQIQLLGSTSLGDLNNMIAALKDKSTVGAENGAVELSSQMVDIPSVLSEKLAYGENYVTEASAHQYRIWLAQAQADNEKKRTASKIDAKLSRFGATQWDTHEGYLLTVTSAVQLDIERMKGALSLVVQRHGALRTAFKYDEGSSKLMQVVYPYADFNAEFVDYSSHLDPKRAVYDHCVKMNTDPGFKLDQLPLMKTTLFDTGNKRWSFCMVIHHIIMDDASVQILFKDLFQYYMGVEDIPPVKLHYSDFSDWLVENPVKKETTEKQLGFWQKNLENIPPLYLPIAKRSETPLCEMTQIDVDIDMDIITRFNHLISNAGVTRFAGYFAAYNILLHKFSAQSTFVVGTAVTERDHSQLNNTVGFFANMLPIKTDIKPSSTFEEYLRAFKDSLFSSLENNDVTYEDIVGRVKTSSEGRTLFKHLFAQGSLVDEIKRILKLHDLDVSSIQPLPNGEEKYETLLTVDGSAGNAVLRFDNHLFSENVARMFLKAYVTVIETIVKDETIKIQDLAIIADSEQSHLIDVVSSEGPVNPIESLVHTLIEKRAAASPFLTAVEFGEETMSYAQLNARANQIARALVLQGVKADVVVAICFDRSILQILAVLAVVKAGGCFMTIDPEDPVLRKEFMIKESNAKFFLTTSFHGNQIAKQIAEQALVVELDDPTFEKRLDKIMGENIPLRNLTPSNLAYIMFTSGSTGKPKGVMIQHRSIANLVQHSDVYGFGKGARVLQSLSYIFDPFVVDVFGTLAHGGTLVLGAKEMVLGDIGTAIKKFNINVVHVTPSILAVVPLEDYPTLETVVVAGEALPKKVIDDWAGKVRLMNMYGPTEAAVDCISCEVKSSAMVGIIGRPMKNCRVYVLDENLRPAPVGVEGEIHIGGIQVSAGYLNQPDLTRSAFISNPFVSGERLYKTGDVGIIRQDNTIEYCGRKDSQIKLRGQRIELGEIEDAILHFDEIQLAACVVREVKGNPAVVAFVEFKKDANVAAMSEYEQVEKLAQTKEALKFHLAERLPRFMFPSMFIDLPSLPRTASGKVDRKLLKTIDLAQFTQEAAGDVGLPASDVETGLMAIFAPILKVEINSFGVEQDLFSVGLNSLLAVQASEAISKTFNCHMSLNNIYLRPTIRELSTVIIDAMGQDVRQIQQAEDAEQDNLIEFLPIKRKGAKPRIFLVHDVTGMSTPFMRLGAYMPNEMYAIGDKYFGQREGFADLKAMAAHYVSLIREVQPKGPYIICGYSFGGTVALSMACMLRDMGETVSRLILLDAIFLNKSEREGLKAGDWTKRSIERISENFPEISDEWKKRLRKEIRKNLEFMFDHDAEYYDGETTLVIPKDRSWYRTGHASDFDTGADDANGWRRRISNLTMKVSGGRHDTMLAPAYVKSLAKVMREIVAECPSGEDAPTPAGAAPPMVAPARTAASAAVPAMEAPKSVAAPLVAPPRVAVEARSSVPVLDADELAKISTTKTEKEKKTGLKFFGMTLSSILLV
ncbi:hypothetical protein HK101_010930 [Irineochytrium annulatum]|nr:hypothetical protein HK101_010930 [Irineochytrium annulatum]